MSRFEQEGDIPFQLNLLLNEGLELQDNFRGALLEIENVLAAENTVQHGLGFIPTGYIILYSEDPAIFSGARIEDWTIETIFLNSSATSQRVRLFVL
jgi:hypothetical protein